MKTLDEIREIIGLDITQIGEDGGCGWLRIGTKIGSVIWSFGGGWEHGSFSPFDKKKIPTWSDMCKLKDLFWNDEEVVVQYHPRKSEYVNNMPNCLHLWRPINQDMPTPPSIMVGIKGKKMR